MDLKGPFIAQKWAFWAQNMRKMDGERAIFLAIPTRARGSGKSPAVDFEMHYQVSVTVMVFQPSPGGKCTVKGVLWHLKSALQLIPNVSGILARSTNGAV